MSGEETLDQIREAQTSAETESPSGEESELRYVLQATEVVEPPQIEQRIRDLYGIDAQVERIFDEDPDPTVEADLGRFCQIRIPGIDESALTESPFELAYDMQRRLEAVSLEPDLATEFYAPQPPADSVAAGGCWVNGIPPDDRGWAPRKVAAPGAWAYSEARRRPDRGRGVDIAQIDTGMNAHAELVGAIRMEKGFDFVDNDPDATDPLEKVLPIDTPGHGISTASVAVSRGTVGDPAGIGSGTGAPGIITGSAPDADLIPIRSVRTVVRANQVNVARGVDFARRNGYPIVTMSLGGLPSVALRAAIGRAVEANMLVMAAAGNCVRLVVYPARYAACLAIAGINIAGKPWRGSSRGPSVDVSAPAELVWRAFRRSQGEPVTGADGSGEGTSFSVALTAGVAALWLAHDGYVELVRQAEARGQTLQESFRTLLKASARPEGDWDFANFGAGIVDAAKLLRLSDDGIATASAHPAHVGAAGVDASSYAAVLDDLLADPSLPPARELVGPRGMSKREKEAFGLEIVWLIFKSRTAAVHGVAPSALAATHRTARPHVSRGLARILSRPANAGLRGMIGSSG